MRLSRNAQASNATSSPKNGATGQAPFETKYRMKARLIAATAATIIAKVRALSGGLGRKVSSRRRGSEPFITQASGESARLTRKKARHTSGPLKFSVASAAADGRNVLHRPGVRHDRATPDCRD